MDVPGITIAYTLCFCLHGDDALVILRAKAPNLGRWNGLGGKIEPGERVVASVRREILEEAGFELDESGFCYRGVVSWNRFPGMDQTEGMHLFVIRVDATHRTSELPVSDEGILEWKPIAWLCQPRNDEVADNLFAFLDQAIDEGDLMHVRCLYDRERLLDVHIDRLTPADQTEYNLTDGGFTG